MTSPNTDAGPGLREWACRLNGEPEDFDPLLEMIGDAQFVLLGEASHGTHEFYRMRAQITKRLIEEKGFTAVAVEGDWPDAYRVNRYVRGATRDRDAVESLSAFGRFPQWMWRNADVLDFVGWLRNHNERTRLEPVGFYGLDLYSLHASMAAVLGYLDTVDPKAARRARQRYACFDHFGEDTQAYGYAARFALAPSCEDAVVAQLLDLQRSAARYSAIVSDRADFDRVDEQFFAEQNARLVANAERYYRAMFGDREGSWNLRDLHMTDTLDALVGHLSRDGVRRKVVVWAHNSHVGDARATQMSERGELNLGQLVRERHRKRSVLVGFTTHSGSVTAASDWDAPAERKRVRPALKGSYEDLFHQVGSPNLFMNLRDQPGLQAVLGRPRLERAIGVIYLPRTERVSHYFEANLPLQFDAVFHYDATRAVEPLERSPIWERGEVPETYPTAL